VDIDAIAKGAASMKTTLEVWRGGVCLHDGSYDICDAESFGEACAQIWTHVQERKFETARNIGALMESLEENVLDKLDNAEIRIKRAR
jgi:hypothetical protein